MNRIAILILAVLTLSACQDRGPTAPQAELEMRAAAVSGIVYQVTGSGAVVREDIEGTPRETYGFHAQVDAAGNASGEAEVSDRSEVITAAGARRGLPTTLEPESLCLSPRSPPGL